MEKDFENLKELLNSALKESDIVVDNINCSDDGSYSFITVVIDKLNGFEFDDLINASEMIKPIVENQNIFDRDYVLDVISKEKGDV